MKKYAAPMEGITGYVFRNAHHGVFPGADRYYTPFLSPGTGKALSTREKNDILPEHNRGIKLVPQILTNHAEAFLQTAACVGELGYSEVNLNLGCPSGTVTAKRKGAGFLADRDELDRFFETVFQERERRFPELKISVKTRLGVSEPEEFDALIPIFNRYPISELIIHPRVRVDFYKGIPRMDVFRRSLEKLTLPVCLNGNLFSVEDAEHVWNEYESEKKLQAVMLGRGLIASPWLAQELSGTVLSDGEIVEHVKQFHVALVQGYQEIVSGDTPLLFKMKELWYYLGCHFPDCGKELKRIRKAQHLSEYQAAVDSLLTLEHFQRQAQLSL